MAVGPNANSVLKYFYLQALKLSLSLRDSDDTIITYHTTPQATRNVYLVVNLASQSDLIRKSDFICQSILVSEGLKKIKNKLIIITFGSGPPKK